MKQHKPTLYAVLWPIALLLMASSIFSCSSRLTQITSKTKPDEVQGYVMEDPCKLFSSEIEAERTFLGEKRNLKLYENAGSYCFDLQGKSLRLGALAELRDFIWQHWQNHVQGYFVLIAFSKEGEPRATYGFIEPDSMRNWRVALLFVALKSASSSNDWRSAKQRFENDVYSIDRIKPPKDELHPPTVLPDKEVLSPDSYLIRLKDKSGKVLMKL
jgi:hypothetical protein